jgi:hypothetical protein
MKTSICSTLRTIAVAAFIAVAMPSGSNAVLITFNEATTATYLDLTLDLSDGYAVNPGYSGAWVLNQPGPLDADGPFGWSASFGFSLGHGILGSSVIVAPAEFDKAFTYLNDLTFWDFDGDGVFSPELSFWDGAKARQWGLWTGEIPSFSYVDGNKMKVNFTWNVGVPVPDEVGTFLLILSAGLMAAAFRRNFVSR